MSYRPLMEELADDFGGQLRVVAPTHPKGGRSWLRQSDRVAANFGAQWYDSASKPGEELGEQGPSSVSFARPG